MFEKTFKNIDYILYKDAGSDSELDYVVGFSLFEIMKETTRSFFLIKNN